MKIRKDYLLWFAQGIIAGGIIGYYLGGILLFFGFILIVVLPIIALITKNSKSRLRIIGFILSSAISTIVFTYVPCGADADIASNVGKYIGSRYDKFDNRSIVDSKHRGKIFYSSPGKYPTIIFYEVTEPEDIKNIELYAREAIDKYGIPKVKLVFHKEQNWHGQPGGAGMRSFEFAFKKVVITK